MNSKTLLYILKRIALAALTVWVVITLTFFVTRAVPGGPFMGEKAVSEAALAALEAKYGLDKPVMEQYFTYLSDVVTKLDFGPSLKLRGRMVMDVISDGINGVHRILIRHQPPIYQDLDSPMVKMLVDIYRSETGDMESQPMVIGGGTYARATPNIIAYGAAFPGDEDLMHQKNERLSLERLRQMTKIYTQAIYKLSSGEYNI